MKVITGRISNAEPGVWIVKESEHPHFCLLQIKILSFYKQVALSQDKQDFWTM